MKPLIIPSLLLAPLFAQVTGTPVDFGSIEHIGIVIFQYGVAGLGLYWFAMRVEKKLQAIDRTIDRFSKVMLLEVTTRPSNVSESTKYEARKLLGEIKAKENTGKTPDTKQPFFD